MWDCSLPLMGIRNQALHGEHLRGLYSLPLMGIRNRRFFLEFGALLRLTTPHGDQELRDQG